MKQKGELKVYSADSDVAQSGSRTKTRTKARTVVLDSKYQLGDEVGRGSSGKVYKALNRDTGDFRAIKEIPIRDVPVARLQAVQTEIEVLHTMQHEKIVHYFETIRTDSHLYLVLEYMENGSLAGVVRKYGCFPRRWWRCTCGRCSTASSGSTRTACATATSRAPTCSSRRKAT